MQFQKFDGEPIDNVALYVKRYMKEHPEAILMIGSDSQQKAFTTSYSAAIVLYRKGRGGHVIIWKQRIKKIRDLFSRLWKEVEFTAHVVSHLIESGIDQDEMIIHIDVNPDPAHESNCAYQPSFGFFKGTFGFNADQIMVKPLGYVSSHVSDKYVR